MKTSKKKLFLKLCLYIVLLIIVVKPNRTYALNNAQFTDLTQYFLFCYFLQQNQGMCYAISTDGFSWQPLNNSRPYLVPNVDSQKLMRDPSINLGPDGIYRVVWTTGWHGTNIGYAYSKDLIHWSQEQLLPVMKNMMGTKNCWAPEIFYDSLQHQYMIFWSSAVDTVWSIYYTTTRNFKYFSKPEILFYNGGKGGGKAGNQGPIDAFIFNDKTRFILFYKKDDNTRVPDLYYRFGKTPQGPWLKENGPITPSSGDEGPSCVKDGNEYRVYTDPFESHQAFVCVSTDLEKWKQFHTNLKMSHGTVLKISPAMAIKLLQQPSP